MGGSSGGSSSEQMMKMFLASQAPPKGPYGDRPDARSLVDNVLTKDGDMGGPSYNRDMGRIIGWSPDGKLMTTKTHPELSILAPRRNRSGGYQGGGDVGGNPDGGRADGAGNE